MSKKPSLGDVLREARRMKGASLREVEEATDVSNAYLSQMESNLVREPSPNKLLKLAKFYGIPYWTLMEAAGYVEPPKTQTARPSGAQAFLLAEQSLTPEESEALATYLIVFRKMKDGSDTKNRRDKK